MVDEILNAYKKDLCMAIEIISKLQTYANIDILRDSQESLERAKEYLESEKEVLGFVDLICEEWGTLSAYTQATTQVRKEWLEKKMATTSDKTQNLRLRLEHLSM